MNQATRTARGQPLLVLVVLLGGWIAMRAALWQSPFPPLVSGHVFARRTHPSRKSLAAVVATRQRARGDRRGALLASWRMPGSVVAPSLFRSLPAGEKIRFTSQPLQVAPFAGSRPSERHIVGQQLLLAAGFSHMEIPLEVAAYFAAKGNDTAPVKQPTGEAAPAGTPPAPAAGISRWSADGWVLLRQDSAGAVAGGQPSYGRSQAGAVLRYRLAPASRHRPVAYVRASGALAGPRENEVAVGLAARPMVGIPVSVAAEARAYETRRHRELRPAAFAVTELPPAKLPFGLRGEVYAQAGYVGGQFATPFVDGQARVDEHVAGLGLTGELRAGAGAWGGAQKGTSRLDMGPSATISFHIGPTQSRLALDYRWRIAGNAEPDNGPALTISSGF